MKLLTRLSLERFRAGLTAAYLSSANPLKLLTKTAEVLRPKAGKVTGYMDFYMSRYVASREILKLSNSPL